MFCCIFLKFLNFEIFQSFNVCGAQVLRDENFITLSLIDQFSKFKKILSFFIN